MTDEEKLIDVVSNLPEIIKQLSELGDKTSGISTRLFMTNHEELMQNLATIGYKCKQYSILLNHYQNYKNFAYGKAE